MQDGNNNYLQLISKLLDFIYLESVSNPERVKELLIEYGYDFDDLSNEGVNFVKDLERKQRTLLAREKRDQILGAFAVRVKREGHETKEILFKKLKEFAAGDAQLQLAFHKLEALGEDDLQNILSDVEALIRFAQKNEQSGTQANESDT